MAISIRIKARSGRPRRSMARDMRKLPRAIPIKKVVSMIVKA